MLPLFLGAFLSDWAYFRSEQVQWINFAAWLNAGGMVFAVLALVALVVLSLAHPRSWRGVALPLGLVVATFVIGLLSAFHHTRDAFATMPLGLVLSAITLVLAIAALWGTTREPQA